MFQNSTKAHHFLLIVVIGLFLLTTSCSTTKNTFVTRTWHNMNTHYNGYFLAKEEQKVVIKKIEADYKEDFTKILPLYIFPADSDISKYEGDLDSVINRCSGIIQRHTIVNYKTQVEIADAGKWIDDNYVLIGLSEFYKKNYTQAIEDFQYVAKKYPDPKAKYTGQLKSVYTYNRMGQFADAELILDELRTAEDFPKEKKYQRELAIAKTDYDLRGGDYPGAIESIQKAIALTRKKKEKARFNYILGQLNENVGDYENALYAYEASLKQHPAYDIAFNAEMKIAQMYIKSDKDIKTVVKHLLAMAKDGKNTEYRDQIYYVLGDLALKDSKLEEAKEYYRKSIDNSFENPLQKAQSFLRLGDISMDAQNYMAANFNYDSAVVFLPITNEKYAEVVEKKNALKSLATNLNTITVNDSLLKLATLSKREQVKAIDREIRRLKEEENNLLAAAKRRELLKEQNFKNDEPSINSSAGNQLWYFYTPSTVAFGSNEFQSKWGDRPLEDNWRREDKIQEFSDDGGGVVREDIEVSVAKKDDVDKYSDDKYSRSYYLKKIPSTPKAVQKTKEDVVDAYYNVGVIYKEQFDNREKSIQAFKRLLELYPDNKYTSAVYYNLYRSYKAEGDRAKEGYYKKLIFEEFSESPYAKIIRNPTYAKDVVASKNEVATFYEKTYEAFLAANYSEVIKNTSLARSKYAKSSLMPKFSLLGALSIGKTKNVQQFEDALNQLLIVHPAGEEHDQAKEILAKLSAVKSDLLKKEEEIRRNSFLYKDEGVVACMLITTVPKDSLGAFELELKEFVNTYSDSLSLTAENYEGNNVFIIANFDSYVAVKSFSSKMNDTENPESFVNKTTVSYKDLFIADRDHKLLLKNKELTRYLTGFRKAFPK